MEKTIANTTRRPILDMTGLSGELARRGERCNASERSGTARAFYPDGSEEHANPPRVLHGLDTQLFLRNLSAFQITENELTLIAAAAMIGDSTMPSFGYRIPAATGTHTAL